MVEWSTGRSFGHTRRESNQSICRMVDRHGFRKGSWFPVDASARRSTNSSAGHQREWSTLRDIVWTCHRCFDERTRRYVATSLRRCVA